MNRIHCESLVAGYSSSRILNGITLSCEIGKVLAVLGPNGSGKSTLLRCLSRLLMPTSGTIEVLGKNIWQMSQGEAAKLVSVVPQQEDTIFRYSVREVVAMGRHAWSYSGPKLVDAALEEAGCATIADRAVSEISGGERQRVLLARAIAQDTPVLLLDEPTAHMDVGYQIATLAKLRSLADQGKAIIAVLHDLNLAAGLADHAALMHAGRVESYGHVEEVLAGEEIERVYGARFSRTRDPFTGRILISPEVIGTSHRTSKPRRIHVIGGGGSAAPLLTELWQLGHTLTLGVAHELDSDIDAAQRLHIPYVAAPPFSQISDDLIAQAASLAKDAEIILVCAAPFGSGNIANLELAAKFATSGKPVLLPQYGEQHWDFVEGAATKLYDKILQSGGVLYERSNAADTIHAMA